MDFRAVPLCFANGRCKSHWNSLQKWSKMWVSALLPGVLHPDVRVRSAERRLRILVGSCSDHGRIMLGIGPAMAVPFQVWIRRVVINRAMLVVCHKFPRTSSPHCCIYLPQVWPGRVVGGGLRVVGWLAGLQVGCTVNTVVVVHLAPVWFTFNTGGVVHLKHRCGSP